MDAVELATGEQVVRQFVVTRATPGTVINDDYGASADGDLVRPVLPLSSRRSAHLPCRSSKAVR